MTNSFTKFFLFKLFSCHPDVKRRKISEKRKEKNKTLWFLPGLRHEIFAELTEPLEPHLHFTTFETHSLTLCWKTDISKTAWINAWLAGRKKLPCTRSLLSSYMPKMLWWLDWVVTMMETSLHLPAVWWMDGSGMHNNQ